MSRVVLYSAAAIAGIGVVYLMARKKPGEGVGAAAGRLAVQTVADAGVGAVKGIGTVFGVPDTNTSQCEQDLAAGRHWDASFSCPAGKFLGGYFNSTGINAAEQADARQIDRIIERQQAAWAGSWAGALADPYSTVPQGYRVNQWGGLEQIPVKTAGYTGSW